MPWRPCCARFKMTVKLPYQLSLMCLSVSSVFTLLYSFLLPFSFKTARNVVGPIVGYEIYVWGAVFAFYQLIKE